MKKSSPMTKLPHFFEETFLISRIRWAEIRTSILLRFVVLPMFLLSFMVFFRLAGTTVDAETAFYIVTGNIVLSVSLGPISLLMQEMANKKRTNALDLFKMLPVSLGSLLSALVITEFLAALPAALASFVLGLALFRCSIKIGAFTLLVIPALFISSFSIAGIGAYIGWRARSPLHANLLGQIVLYVLAFIVPVMIPETRLPMLVAGLSLVSPVHQAARLFRHICLGTVTMESLGLILLLLLEGIAFIILSVRAIRARD